MTANEIKSKLLALNVAAEINSDGEAYARYDDLDAADSPALRDFIASRTTEHTDKALFIS